TLFLPPSQKKRQQQIEEKPKTIPSTKSINKVFFPGCFLPLSLGPEGTQRWTRIVIGEESQTGSSHNAQKKPRRHGLNEKFQGMATGSLSCSPRFFMKTLPSLATEY